MGTKRIVIVSDMHCGHRVGLTPPSYQVKEERWPKWSRIQAECWAWLRTEVNKIKPIHLLINNGDCIDGRGEKSGGTELITGDREEQVKMAVSCMKLFNAKHNLIIRGTDYHTGEIECFEDSIAQQMGCKIGDHDWPEVNGVIFDCKHFIASSSIPHGRHTAVARDVLWNELWASGGYQPSASYIIRSHVHYLTASVNPWGERMKWGITTPALQAMGTRFGSKKCSGFVNYGFLQFDVKDNGEVVWTHHLARIRSQIVKTSKY